MSDQLIKEEFVASQGKRFPWQIGKKIAASLPGFIFGFIAGAVVLSPLIIWLFTEIYSIKKDLAGCLGANF